MSTSIFDEKLVKPDQKQLSYALGKTYEIVEGIFEYIREKYPDINDEWKYYNKKSGWIYKVFSKKRCILYIVPLDGNFLIAFILGDKATDKVVASNLPDDIKHTLVNEKRHMEGRVLHIEVKSKGDLETIIKLIDIKMGK